MVDQTPKQRVNAALALAETGDFSGLPVIVDALTHGNPEVRIRAAYCCQRIGFAAAIDALSEMARRDAVSDNRNQAIYGLATIGRPAVVPPLIDTLADPDAERRDDGRTALYRILGADMLPLVADEDEPDDDERDRVAAWWSANAARFDPSRVFAFGELAGPGVLVNQLKAANTWPPDAYLNALRDWTAQDFGTSPRPKVLRAWEQWWAANRGNYEAGRRSFFGRPVP